MKIIKNNKILATVFMFVGAICLFSTFFKNSNIISVYAMEQESEDVLDEQVIVDTSEVELLIRLKYGCKV